MSRYRIPCFALVQMLGLIALGLVSNIQAAPPPQGPERPPLLLETLEGPAFLDTTWAASAGPAPAEAVVPGSKLVYQS